MNKDEVQQVVRMRLNLSEAAREPSEELKNLSPDALEVYEEMLEKLGFDRHATATEEDRQRVNEDQILVLGDAGVGKTSLVKSLTGEKHDPEQAKTHGVEEQFVNRKWQKIENDKLIFGDFNRFSKTEKSEWAILPRIFNKDRYRYRYGRNAAEHPDRFYVVVFKFMFGWLTSFLHDNPEDSDHVKDGFFFLFVLLRPLLAVCFGDYWAQMLLISFILVLETLKTAKGERAKDNFFTFSGILVGQQIAVTAIRRLGNSYFHPNNLPSLNDVNYELHEYLCTVMPSYVFRNYSLKVVMNFWSELSFSLFFFFLLAAACFFFYCCYVILSYVCSKILIELQVFGKRLTLIFDVLLDVQSDLYEMALTTWVTLILTLYPPFPPAISYKFFFIYYRLIVFVSYIRSFYQQGHYVLIASNYYITAAVVLDFSLLCYTIFRIYVQSNFASLLPEVIIMFTLEFTFHCYGRWCEIKRLFKDKSFGDIVFRNEFRKTALVIEKANTNKGKLERALNRHFCSLKLKLIDFAGDRDYYFYHHIFLKKHAIYLIVFNIKSFIKDNFKDIMRNIKRLRFWFESVCSHIPRTTPIILVGTHSGTLKDEDLKIVNYYLHEELWQDFCDHLIINDEKDILYFNIENTDGAADKGVRLLRKIICDIAEKETGNKLVPLSWIKVQDYLLTLQRSHQTAASNCCVTVDDFRESIATECSSLCSTEMLQYFNSKGLIMYLRRDEELSKWIVLNPAITVDIIVQLLNPSPQTTRERGYRQSWELLTQSGMLAKRLLQRILEQSCCGGNYDVLKKYLEGYDLICPLKHEAIFQVRDEDPDEEVFTTGYSESTMSSDEVTHFIPSLLPESVGLKTVWHAQPDDTKFYVSFVKFPPEPLFHRLLSRAHKQSKTSLASPNPVVRRDDGLFWLTPNQPYRLKLLKEESLIEVTVGRSTKTEVKPSDVLSQVWYMVKSIQQRDFQFVKFHCGPECPSRQCPGGEQFGTNSGICGQSCSTKRHIFNVLPACKSGSHCVSFYCLNQNFESQLMHWVPNAPC